MAYIISQIRDMINIDSRNVGELEDTEAISFINRAMDEVNDFRLKIKDPTLCKDQTFSGGEDMPSDFGKWAGTFPLHFSNEKVVLDISPGPVKARYLIRKPHIASLSDTFPLPDDLVSLVVQKAAAYKIKQNEDETQQDERLIALREANTSVARGV
jgi:hypothetical protein